MGVTIDKLDSASVIINYTEDLSNIGIIDQVIIDNNLWGRPDIIVNKYYNGDMRYLKLLLDFNGISDVTEMNLGMVLDIPDMQSLLDIIEIGIDEVDLVPPGVLKSNDNKIVNKSNAYLYNITIAVPKLEIKLEKIKYDSESGIIKL
jgi:hypothetical protein